MKRQKRSYLGLLGALLLLAAISLQVIPQQKVGALGFTTRRITLQAGATDGGSKPGGVVNHFFEFTTPVGGGGSVGSIKFEYCTSAVYGTSCTTPTGLVTTSATLQSQTGATGFTLVNTTNGAPYLTRTAANIAASTALAYQLNSITNPTTTNMTFFVRISYYTSTNVTGSAIDTGTVAASTADPVVLNGTMPESLIFCTGATVGTISSVPNCSTATSASNIVFSDLFSPTVTMFATSQMAASTNAGSGYTISINGATMTSGSNTITAMGSATASVTGIGQFGSNLKANTSGGSFTVANFGTEVAPATASPQYKGQSKTGYDTVDIFKFVSGDIVAASDASGAGGTDAQIFTNSYIVNVPGNQPAGLYSTTLTYICTPTF